MKSPILNFTKIGPMGATLTYADGHDATIRRFSLFIRTSLRMRVRVLFTFMRRTAPSACALQLRKCCLGTGKQLPVSLKCTD
jgi:hypothetical protein